jgi:putative ABC transport system permease protein
VVAEVALAVVLLVGAGLFLGSFARLMRVDVGLDYRNVLALSVGLRVPPGQFAEVVKRGNAYVQQMVDAVSSVPGVEAVATVNGGLPLTGSWSRTGFQPAGAAKLEGDDSSIDRRSVSVNYLQTLRIPLIAGRYLSDGDRAGSEPVMVINDAAAKKYWPGQNPLGQRATFNKVERVVVGVVANIHHLGPETPPRQEAYIPALQDENTGGMLVIRTAQDPLTVLPAVRAAIWSVNREQRLTSDTLTLEAYMDRLIAQRRFNMALLSLFGALGLVIAAVGIYGVLAYVVAERTNEIGAGVLSIAGLALGAGVAWALSSFLQVQTFLFQMEPTSWVVYGGAVGTLAAAALIASAVPAFRAASIDPLIALRH